MYLMHEDGQYDQNM